MNRKQWKRLGDCATEHRVVPLLYQRLMAAGDGIQTEASRSSLEYMSAYSRQVSKNNLLFYGELRKLLSALDEKNIPVILLKGIYLAEHVYENRGLREMNDMDLLFKKEHLEIVYQLLTEMGYQPISHVYMNDINQIIQINKHLPRLIKKDVAGIEIHWNITKPGRSYHIEPDGIIQRASPINKAGVNALSLTAEDLLLHLCLHTSYQHNFAFGLRPFCDLKTVIDRFDKLDWDEVCSRSAEYGWRRGVLLSLVIAKDFLGADVPEDIIKRLHADDSIPALVETARRQILTKKEDSKAAGNAVITFASAEGLTGKTSAVIKRLFISKDQMIAKYPIRPGSPMIYLWYLVRFGQMIWFHTSKILRVSRGDPEYTGIIERKEELHSWLNKEN